MANLYWRETKSPKKEVYAALMKELVDCTDDAFEVKFGGDGAGAHVIVYVEASAERRKNNCLQNTWAGGLLKFLSRPHI